MTTSALPTTTARTGSRASSGARWTGWSGVVGGVLGAVQAAVVLAVPPQVDPGRYSYPFSSGGYLVAQVTFAVQHLLLLAFVLGLLRLCWRTGSLLTRGGLVLTAAGFAALTAVELFAITAASSAVGSAAATAVDNSYGAPMIALGVGLVLAGIGLARRGPLTGWARWLPLVLGIYVFVVLMPAVFGPQVLGRLAIGAWMLLFGLLGWVLVGLSRRPAGTA